ncbi:salicylate hydroxylase [Pseudomonas baetica]|uniref:Salicylate hydroxylase n=1 Tax=Pseudomonas baetica TaxID=674054 RepID=A0ABX4Q7P4_9PSED|nr:salicylate hydroxylase [Pseudomonas baetica]PKA68125.1 salicylate hydroxylase [Pseudomonas baetica]PKA68860.1 salicylate hydroxylase [Pseudomonas baetica]PKA68879.1 salicylate hydroxylase [Pseudomonas baetica]PKA70796.1 salicylate hydroxylase [Pseudomonas baetica]
MWEMTVARCSRRLKAQKYADDLIVLVDSPFSKSAEAEVSQKSVTTSDHP